MKKLFKLLSLLRLLRELRYTMRGHGHGHGYGRRMDHYGEYHHGRAYRHDYHPLSYGRPRKPKLKHLVRDLLISRRY